MFGFAQPNLEIPSNLVEIVLLGGGALLRIQQRADGDWIGIVHCDGHEFDVTLRATSRDALLNLVTEETEKPK